MSIETLTRRGLPTAAALSVLCLALVSGCKSSGTSSGSAGPPAGGNPSAASPASAGPTTAAAAGSSSAISTCPTAAVVSAALGKTMPTPVQNGGASELVCNYSDPSTGANLVISLSPLPAASATAAVIKTVADTQAQAQGVTASPVSGLGSVAYTFTQKDAAANPDGVATTVLIVLVGLQDIDIDAQAPADKVVALAHAIIGS